MEIEVVAPINIALIKYWGKQDTTAMLPLNDSLSLSVDALYARTKLSIVEQTNDDISGGGEDQVVINGKVANIAEGSRFHKVFGELRAMVEEAGVKKELDEEGTVAKQRKMEHQLPVRISVDSTTNFPTCAGLASSAAGFAAVAFAFGQLYSLDQSRVAKLARLGSGSATRSVLNGWVLWSATDGGCHQLFPPDHWTELCAVIAVTSGHPKAVPSTAGMQRSVETSELLTYRASHCVPRRVGALFQAVADKDFPQFAELVMQDSNQLHAICADTFPPLAYLSEVSHSIIRFIHQFNANRPPHSPKIIRNNNQKSLNTTNNDHKPAGNSCDGLPPSGATDSSNNGDKCAIIIGNKNDAVAQQSCCAADTTNVDSGHTVSDFRTPPSATTVRAAYSFDAGPNACIFMERETLPEFLAAFVAEFPPLKPETDEFIRSQLDGFDVKSIAAQGDFDPTLSNSCYDRPKGQIDYLVVSGLGKGPYVPSD